MGLAAALKRKVGQPQPRDPKRLRAEAVFVAAAVPTTVTGRLHVHSADTRSARRKQNQAQRQQAQIQAVNQQQAGAEADDGDSEGEPDAVALLNGSGAADEATEQLPRTVAAYKALLSSLKSTSRDFAQLRSQREREEAGMDESENESEVEDEEGVDELDSSDDGGMDGRSDGDIEEEDGIPAEAEAGFEEPEEGAAEEPEDEQDEEAEGVSSDEEQQPQPQQSGAAAGSAAPAAALQDCYGLHFDRELSEEAAGALQAGSASSSRAHFTACADVSPKLQQWQSAELQANDAVSGMPQVPAELAAYGVKERLATRWREAVLATHSKQQLNKQQQQQATGTQAANGMAAAGLGDFVSGRQQALFALLSTYSDLLLPCRPYPTDAAAPDPELDAVLLHVLSHCAKAADRIKRNSERIKAAADAGNPLADPPRDQGFTRPKALVLLPLRSNALRVVLRIAELAVKETRTDSVQGKAKLLEEFGAEEEDDLPPRAAAARAHRPPEHTALFSGNLDDHFRLGIKLTRGAVRLFADFYQSDVIVASPVALATKLAEKEDGGADFLSSIEIVVVERADVLQMQNWEHVRTVLSALNHLPSQQRGADIMRVRPWALSGWGNLYRQTILLSSFASPEMNALLTRGCANFAGCFRLKPTYQGVLSQVLHQVRQVFERLPPPPAARAAIASAGSEPSSSSSMAAEADARLEHFKRVAWPRLKEAGGGGGQLLYIPSYFDFVRVRNFLKGEGAAFLVLSEYVEPADAARARSYFFSRRRPLLLLTERAQFYHRYRIRGIKDILFYQLPEHAQFYAELLNLLEEEESAGSFATVHTLFSRLDAPRLERIVGSQRSAKMLKRGGTNTFLFC